MTIGPVDRSTALAASAGASRADASAAEPPDSLLPDAAAGNPDDALAALYSFLTASQVAQVASDTTMVDVKQEDRRQDLVQEKRDLDAAQKAAGAHGFFGSIEKLAGDLLGNGVKLDASDLVRNAHADIDEGMLNNPRFWSDLASMAKTVGEVAAIVAGTALAVGTGGAGGVVLAVAVALSVSALSDQQFHVLHALGVSDKAAGWADAGMGISSAALSCGATLATSASSAAATGMSQVAHGMDAASAAVEGVGDGATAVATVRQGQIDSAAANAQADATADQDRIAKTDRVVEWLIGSLQESKKSLDAAKASVASSIETRSATNVALSTLGKA